MFKKLNNKKGFTLMEMLIVVAIIAILVAIAIPTMASALEKSRESADAANIRACYAEVMTAALTNDYNMTKVENGAFTVECSTKPSGAGTYGEFKGVVTLTQQQAKWQNAAITNIAGVKITADSTSGSLDNVKSKGTVTIIYSESTGSCSIKAD